MFQGMKVILLTLTTAALITAALITAAPATAALALGTAPPSGAAPPVRPQVAVWPLQPRPQVVHGFELPAKAWLPGHRGIDLAGTPGQPVLASTAGTITYAGPLAGRGVVTVSTGPRRTTYEPVVPALAVGAAVTPGTLIGHLSAAGSHCGPVSCLHWGLIQGKQYLNPLTLVPNHPVRLLPLSPAPPPRAAVPPLEPSPRAEHAGAPHDGSRAGERTAAAIVGTTAALMLAGGLLIRRH
jgi:murein DD-endopeptidase MepM/ murein hydrolase activator NlpD